MRQMGVQAVMLHQRPATSAPGHRIYPDLLRAGQVPGKTPPDPAPLKGRGDKHSLHFARYGAEGPQRHAAARTVARRLPEGRRARRGTPPRRNRC